MKPDVPFENLRHQAIDGPAASNREVEGLGTIRLCFQQPFQRINLPPDAPNPHQKFLFISNGVGHCCLGICFFAQIGYGGMLCSSTVKVLFGKECAS